MLNRTIKPFLSREERHSSRSSGCTNSRAITVEMKNGVFLGTPAYRPFFGYNLAVLGV